MPYSLLIDEVGHVLTLEPERVEYELAALPPLWRQVAGAIYKRPEDLLVVLDIARVLDIDTFGHACAGRLS